MGCTTSWSWVVLGACFGMNILNAGYIKSFGILFVEVEREFQTSASVTSVLMGLHAAFSSITALVVLNVVLERFTIRRTAIVGVAVLFLGVCINSLAHNLYILVFSQGALAGVGSAMLYGPGLVQVSRYFHKRRAMATAICSCGVSTGGMLLPPLVQFLISEYGLRGAFLIISGLMLQILVFVLLYRPVLENPGCGAGGATEMNVVENGNGYSTDGEESVGLIDQNSCCGGATEMKVVVNEDESAGLIDQNSCCGGATEMKVVEKGSGFSSGGDESAGLIDQNSCCGGATEMKVVEKGSGYSSGGGESAGLIDQNSCCGGATEMKVVEKGSGYSSGGGESAGLIEQREYGPIKNSGSPCGEANEDVENPEAFCGEATEMKDIEKRNSFGGEEGTEIQGPSKKKKVYNYRRDNFESGTLCSRGNSLDERVSKRPVSGKHNFDIYTQNSNDDSTAMKYRWNHNNDNIQENACDVLVLPSSPCVQEKKEPPDKYTCKSNKPLLRCIEHLNLGFFRRPLYLLIFGFTSCGFLGVGLFQTFLPPLAKENGLTQVQAALLLSLFNGLELISRLIASFLAEIRSIKRYHLIATSMVLLGTLNQLTRYFEDFTWMISYVAVFGLLNGFYPALHPAVTIDFVGMADFPKVFGYIQVFHGAMMTACYPLMGGLRDLTGSYTASFHFLGACKLLSAIFLFLLPLAKNKTSP